MKPKKKTHRAAIEAAPNSTSGVDNAAFIPEITADDAADNAEAKKRRLFEESALALLDDEFWDYDKQIDLESFSAQRVYDILTSQSHDMTLELGKIKDDAKNLYQR